MRDTPVPSGFTYIRSFIFYEIDDFEEQISPLFRML